jgi:hypothetical protein
MTSEFNPLEYARQLEAAGVTPSQAQAHAAALTRALTDVTFSRDLVRVEGNLRHEIHFMEERLGSRIDQLKLEFGARMTALEHEMAIHRWVLGFVLASNLAILGVVIKPMLA